MICIRTLTGDMQRDTVNNQLLGACSIKCKQTITGRM